MSGEQIARNGRGSTIFDRLGAVVRITADAPGALLSLVGLPWCGERESCLYLQHVERQTVLAAPDSDHVLRHGAGASAARTKV